MNRVRKLAIVGGGRAAWAFGSSWLKAGNQITGVLLRTDSLSHLDQLLGTSRLTAIEDLRSADAVLVAVQDHQLPEVAATVSRTLADESPLFHPSGSRTSRVFGRGPTRFCLHPLMALPAAGERVSFRDRLLVAEGTEEGIMLAREIAADLGARFALVTAEEKPAYHAAAVMASNYVAALLASASALLEAAGIDAVSKTDLLELARSGAENWAAHEGAAAFTGPIARGDAEVVEQHLHALSGTPYLKLYRLVGAMLAEKLEALTGDPQVSAIAHRLRD